MSEGTGEYQCEHCEERMSRPAARETLVGSEGPITLYFCIDCTREHHL